MTYETGTGLLPFYRRESIRHRGVSNLLGNGVKVINPGSWTQESRSKPQTDEAVQPWRKEGPLAILQATEVPVDAS